MFEKKRKPGNIIIYVLILFLLFSAPVSAEDNSTNSSSTGSSLGNEFLFILGTDFNNPALSNAVSDSDISSELNITIFTKNDTVPEDFDFSKYSMIFIESQDESAVEGWNTSIDSAEADGSMVIGYNLSSNITYPNVDLYSDNYTEIERYWVQGGETNMVNMLKLMGQEFAGAWEGETISEPEILQKKTKITYILSSDTSVYYLNTVLAEREVINDLFDVNVMTSLEAANSTINVSDDDVIIMYMVGASELSQIKDELLAAKENGAQIGMFGMLADTYGISTFNMSEEPYSAMTDYLYNDGYENMENWIRCIGATLESVYIEYAPAEEPEVAEDGIYHPDAYPRIFGNITEYLDWYADHGYNQSAITIGLVGNSFGSNSLAFTTEDAIIRELESKGCNVIFTTDQVCTEDVDYFTNNGTVIVDAIISLKGFYLNYDDQEKGVEYLEKYNVPVIKGIQDYYQTPDEYNESTAGLSSSSIAYQVTQPEIDGLLDYIWVAGRVQDNETQQYYYQPIDSQVEWLCGRAISWAELGRKDNADKKVAIIYYNHDGGKNNIGASYLDIGSSLSLLLENMTAAGYDTGNNSNLNGSELIDLFVESRNVGTWAPGELEKVVESGLVTLLPENEYLEWYNTLPESVRSEVEDKWGEAPGDVMVYENESGKYIVIPTIKFGNIDLIPQPMRAVTSDESLLYHNSSIPPTHQYLATYFWINNVYNADAMIHFGTHGTQEWLPGKEVGLWRYDYPSIMVNETPVIYPYIMDNVGEGTQAKRRGDAVIIDHLTPVIIESGLYGDLATIKDKIESYQSAADDNDTAMMSLYRNSTIELYDNLSLVDDLNVSTDELNSMTDDEFENFLDTTLLDYLEDLKDTLIPYGLHVFGVAPEGEELVGMVKSMLGDDFTDHISDFISSGSESENELEDEADETALDLLNATILNGTNVSAAQLEILGDTDDDITDDLDLALGYADNLSQTTREIDQTLRALNAEYIEPGTGNDPILNPDALPTGKNFYSFDQRKIPDEETEEMGSTLIDNWLDEYYAENGTYPNKVAFTLWSVETMRNEGLLEAEIYALLGVKLERSSGRITGFEVIPQENMTHPRIDVLIVPSGLYRDTFPYQIELMDTAVRMVAELNETNETNYVRWDSLKIEDAMLESGYNESVAHNISMSRIFSEAAGTYGTGLSEAVEASDTWDNESELADLYISRMSNIYGTDEWGVNYEDVFTLNLEDVDTLMHSDTSNLYGLIDNDDYYSYMGGLSLAVRSLTGETPDSYISDLTSTDPEIVTLSSAISTELRSRYFNSNWISGMMGYDYAGAREMMNFVENLWGWEATNPDLISDSDWDQIYDIYVNDKYDLGLDEFFEENPYQYQSMTARMLETARKGYWDASDEVIQSLVSEYVESVVDSGVTCCHHTCGNSLLEEYIEGVMSVPGVVDEETAEKYKELMEEATESSEQSSTSSSHSSNGHQTSVAEKLNQTTSTSTEESASNQTVQDSNAGYGVDSPEPAPEARQSADPNYVEGYEMQKEDSAKESDSGGISFSGADILGTLFVVVAAGGIYMGFRKKKF